MRIEQSAGERKVLTHGDLHQWNIIVDCEQNIKAILDWGESCYSVEEMEFYCARWGTMDNEWQAHVPDFVAQDDDRFQFWDRLNDEMRVYVGI